MSVCVVCSSPSPKYKCPTCSQQYCSLSCCKIHKESHPVQSGFPHPILSETSAADKRTDAKSGMASLTSGPFGNLVSSGHLDALLEKHPSLRSQLRQIYIASTDPSVLQVKHQVQEQARASRGGFRGRGRGGGGGGRWNPERGTRDGLARIRTARELEGREGEGMREFIGLVLMNAQETDGYSGEDTPADETEAKPTTTLLL